MRGDNAIRMCGGVCTGGEDAVECGLAAKHARRVRLGVARRIPGAGRVGVGGGEEEEVGGGDVNMHTVQTAGGETVHGWWQRRARWWLKC